MSRMLSKIIIILMFVLAGVLFFHNLTSVNVDIGRHIKLGEIIWQIKSVPDTNLFSFTAPDHSFINHHWLSEVIFYGTYSLGSDWLSGLRIVMALKIIVLLATYLLLFLIVAKRHNIFPVVFAFLISIFVFSARTEPRPEIFSYLIFAAYLLFLYKNRISNFEFRISNFKINSLWFLPILQVFWVNLHIYFVIGPIIFLFFLIDRVANEKINPKSEIRNPKQYLNHNNQNSKRFGMFRFRIWNLFRASNFEFLIFILVVLANLANPNFVEGALYPFKVLNNYGYSVAENSSLFFLAKYFGQWAPQDKLFLGSLIILVVSFVLWFLQKGKTVDKRLRKSVMWMTFKTRTFDLLLIAITAALSFKMQRNIPLYALSLWPVMAKNLDGFSNFEFRFSLDLRSSTELGRMSSRRRLNIEKLRKWLYACAVFVLMVSIYLIVSGRFYRFLDSSKMFGLGVSSAAQDGADFVKENKIQGPVFNNFDIGSYLAWQLYPDQRVFIDGRPEAYPVEFFEKIYKPMQGDEKVWNEMSEKYGINYVFFAHTDMTEWGGEFLARMANDSEWPMVFLNDAVVIFLKNTPDNRLIINKYKVTDDNLGKNITQVLDKLDTNDNNAFVNFGNVLGRFHYWADAVKVYEKLIENQPDNPYGYQGAGYAYASMNDPATQEKAAKNLEKAIALGFKTFNNYFTLGIIKTNLGNYFAAEENITRALKIKPDNQNARQALETIRKQLLIVN